MINNEHSLWWAKYSPTTLEGYIGNENFRNDLTIWIKEGSIPNIILSGIPGTGKTTAAKLITHNIDCDSLYINASDENGIDTIREKVKSFASAASFKPIKIIILDEADFLTPNAQAALRNITETFSFGTRFIFTCNYIEKISDAMRSRLERYELTAPTKNELAKKCVSILTSENVSFVLSDIAKLVNLTYPDNRQTLIKLQSFSKTGYLTINDVLSDIDKVSDDIINLLKTKDFSNFNKIRKILLDLQVRDYTLLYQLLSDRLEDYSNNISIPWYIAESLHQSTSSPSKEITFLGLISRILNESK